MPSGSQTAAGSSRSTNPAATSRSTAVAVNALVTLPILNTAPGDTGSAPPIAIVPLANSASTSSSRYRASTPTAPAATRPSTRLSTDIRVPLVLEQAADRHTRGVAG